MVTGLAVAMVIEWVALSHRWNLQLDTTDHLACLLRSSLSTGLWGTKLYTNHSNSGAWAISSNTVDLTGNRAAAQILALEQPQCSWDYYSASLPGENWTTELSENVENNAWVEKVVDLSATLIKPARPLCHVCLNRGGLRRSLYG